MLLKICHRYFSALLIDDDLLSWVSSLVSIEVHFEMRITFYDATPGGVEAFIICYACISTNTLGSTNKYVLFVFAFEFVCVDLLLLLLLRAGTRGAAFELLCVVASGNILTHSQLPLPPQLRTLSLGIPHLNLALLGFVRASSVGAVFASFGYARNYCAQCLKNCTLPGQFHSKLTMMCTKCECVWVCVCVFVCEWWEERRLPLFAPVHAGAAVNGRDVAC